MAGSPLLSPCPSKIKKKDIGRPKQDIELLKHDIEIPDEFSERDNIPVWDEFFE